jgi:ABC-type branched-subunit amino acid transport system substrate-binding protein
VVVMSVGYTSSQPKFETYTSEIPKSNHRKVLLAPATFDDAGKLYRSFKAANTVSVNN